MKLSAIYDIPHGAGLSIIFPAWMKYVYSHDINRFLQFSARVWDVDFHFSSPEEIALEGINRMMNFFKSIGLPVTLREAGISDDKFEEMAGKCTNFGQHTVGNFVKLTRDDIINIYKPSQIIIYCCL